MKNARKREKGEPSTDIKFPPSVAICKFGSNDNAKPHNNLVIALVVQDPEDGQEKIDDVKVERDSSGNLLLDMIVSHHELGVNKDVPTEYQRANSSVYQIHGLAYWEESRHKAEDYQEPKCTE